MFSHLVKPATKVKLSHIDPGRHDGLTEDDALAKTHQLGLKIADLQELMYAAKKNSLLLVLQGIDTSGKDGSIRHILRYSNVQSTRVVAFKQPTPIESGHDFLWRVHSCTPGKGDVTIFNRSQYEDVLVARVHDLVPKKVWKTRYDHINAFESLLADSGTIILKFFLHISKEEQEQRLKDREADPEKAWKLSVGDWKERELWNDYIDAYEDALSKCSTKEAPWRIVSANHKWFRDLSLAEALHDTLKPYRASWKEALAELGQTEKAEIDAYRHSLNKV